jgi:dTDP-4-amino-4,6-dideoxygalactose transaminase
MSNPPIQIPFNRPSMVGNEIKYLTRSLQEGHYSGDGYFTKECQTTLERITGAAKVLLTTSCTHALEMCAMLLELEKGDEVIIPSFTFVSTVNAFVLRGAKPVFSDVRPDTLNMDENLLEPLITPATRAIVPVHYAGVGCYLEVIKSLADQYNLAIIEDNAHGLFGKYSGQNLGTFGALATLSFHETKNITCGEGGALLINDIRLFERAEILREKGTNRGRFFRGQVDKYTWVDVGSSYLPADLLAAILLAQLESHSQIQAKRKQIWEGYFEHLRDWARANQVQLPIIPDRCEQTYHIFYMLMPTLEIRQAFIHHMRQNGIQTAFHYQPLHLSEMGMRFGGKVGDCPVAESIADRLIRLPLYYSLSQNEQLEIIQAIQQFFG